MSDLSAPPLTLMPLEDKAGPTVVDRITNATFAWPTPPYAAYPSPEPQAEPEPCEIEGLNGKILHARLTLFDPGQGLAQVQVPPARTTMPLRLSQFRRLTLTHPLMPLPHAHVGASGELLAYHPSIEFRVVLNDGPPLVGHTIGHIENDWGLFLFPPAGDDGAVQRLFCPRSAFQKVDFGPPLGQQLLADDTASPAQIAAALAEQDAMRAQRVGDVLMKNKVVSPEQMAAALDAQSRMPMVRIGEALIALGYIDQGQLENALNQQRTEKSVPLGELLVRGGHVQRHELRTALARKMGYPVVDVEAFPVETAALRRVPIAAAKRLGVLPLQELPGRLVLAIEDPSRREVVDEVEFLAQCKVVPVLPVQESLAKWVPIVYQKHGFEDSLPGGPGREHRHPQHGRGRCRTSCWPTWNRPPAMKRVARTTRRSSSPTTRWCA